MQFVPPEHLKEAIPCRFIPLTEQRETIEHFYGNGTQAELEEALKTWLRKEICRLEAQNMPALHPVDTR
jgi:hypothetical protein